MSKDGETFKNLLAFIDNCLEKKHIPDSELIKKHNTDPLNKDWQIPEGALWEQSDVVHDILAFLAEQVIELNKRKHQKIKSFLSWLKDLLGTNIEDLNKKTIIKEFYKHSWEDFYKALKDSKSKIPRLTSYQFHSELQTVHNQVLAELKPLMEQIELTNGLIDQIVYKLYGLNEEEVKLIEEA